jgi:hypothetical protein
MILVGGRPCIYRGHRNAPRAPMGRTNPDPFTVSGLHPPAQGTTAGKHEGVYAVIIDHSEFEVTVDWRIADRLPFHTNSLQWSHVLALIQITGLTEEYQR